MTEILESIIYNIEHNNTLEYTYNVVLSIFPNEKLWLDFMMCYMFQYLHVDNDNKELRDKRTEQYKFKEKLIEKYNNCVITNDNTYFCQGCHIIPFSESKNFDINNGLLLSMNIHKMFDDHLVTIDSITKMVQFKDPKNYPHIEQYYNLYNQKVINAIDNKTLEYLKHHNQKFNELT